MLTLSGSHQTEVQVRHLLTSLALVMLVAGSAAARERGHNVPRSELRTEPLPRPSGWLEVWVPALKEGARVNLYNADGSYDEEALAALDDLWRDRRKRQVRAVHPRLYEVLSIIRDHFGGKRIVLTSGFRQERQTSRHFNASASDINVEGVPWPEVYRYAVTLDRGGMGLGRYPRSGFLHIDFRAPGEPSYRWVDNSGPRGRHKKHNKQAPAPLRPTRPKKPNT